MKKMTFLLSLMAMTLSVNIMASERRVGDSISYESTTVGGDVAIDVSYTNYNSEYKEMEQTFFLKIKDEEIVSKSFYLDKNMVMTKSKAGLMVALCEKVGGTHEYLQLPVGKTLTCRMEVQDVPTEYYEQYKGLFDLSATVWLAPFPVTGVAQFKFAGQIIQAVDYSWNN